MTPRKTRAIRAMTGTAAALLLVACSGKTAPVNTTAIGTPGSGGVTASPAAPADNPTASAGSGSAVSSAGAAAGSGIDTAALITTTPTAKGPLDKVVWNLWEGEPTTVDPYHSADDKENTVNSNMCETLLAIQPDFSIKPNLATSWDNPDPLTWILHLRSGVTFWDGTPMTSADVAYSMEKNRTDTSSFYNYLYGRVASVTASGPEQVTVKLSKPDYLFLDELADYAGVVVSKAFYQAHPSTVGTPDVGVLCTGPFKFGSWTKGDNITVERYDNYWDKTRAPKVKTLTFKFLTDEAAITNALLAGQLDGTYKPPLSGLDQLRHTAVGTAYFGLHMSNLTIVYANPSGAMGNLKLRQALQMAIDWQGVATTILKGTGTPLRSLMPPTIYAFGKDQLTTGYQALPAPRSAQYDNAAALVKQAGPDAKKPVVMAVPAVFSQQQFGNVIADAAKRIGLNFTLKVIPTDQYTNYLYDPKTRAGIDMLYTDFWSNIPDTLDWLGITALKGGSFNMYGYTGIDALYGQAQAEKDPQARARIVLQIQQKTTSELLPMVPGVFSSSRLWMNRRLTGAPASFDYVYYPWAALLGSAT